MTTTPTQDVEAFHHGDADRRARGNRPEAVALTVADRSWTYAGLAAEVDRYARAFVAAGLAPGDRVAFLAHNGLPFVAAHSRRLAPG